MEQVVVVLGRAGADGRIDRMGRARAVHAAALADGASRVTRIVLSGGCKSDGYAESEARQMQRLFGGSDVEVVCEEQSRTTAENAVAVAGLLAQWPTTRELLVVTSLEHWLRTRLIFTIVLRRCGVRVRVTAAACGGWREWAHEMRYLPHVRRNIRDARARLRQLQHDPLQPAPLRTAGPAS